MDTNMKKSDDKKQPEHEYVLVASDETAYVGIIRHVPTGQFYRTYGAVPWEFIPTEPMTAHSIIAKAMLIAYHPEIPLKNHYEWPQKAQESKQWLSFTPTGGMTAEEVEAYGRGQFNPAEKKISKRRTA